MADRETVIYDIGRCICHVPDACKDCSKYGGDNAIRCMEELLADALSLLKAQEPRLLTAEEAEKVPEGKIVWVEQHTREKDYLMPMAATGDGRFGNSYLGILWKEVNTRFYRMWASKPTDEQREAVKWDG